MLSYAQQLRINEYIKGSKRLFGCTIPQKMNRRWICSDVWMDILPSFDHAQLGLKIALLSDRFDILVDKHFDAKTTVLTIWRCISIDKDEGPKANDIGPKAKLSVWIGDKRVAFPFPDRSLPNRICFKHLQIYYIDHSVLAFFRSNQQIWDRSGTNLEWFCSNAQPFWDQPIWDVFIREIWPIFASTIRHLGFDDGTYLDNLRRHSSPTILTDLDQLNSIDSGVLLPDGIADDGPNATSGQALSKWLHTPRKDGQPKQLHRNDYLDTLNLEWVDNFKETFRRATTSVSYHIELYFWEIQPPMEPFKLVNEVTNEKLTLKLTLEQSEKYNVSVYNWLLQRCPIGETATAPVKWKDRGNSGANFNYIRFDLRRGNNSGSNLNSVRFVLGGKHCIGPLSPPAVEEKEEADQSNEK